MSEPQLLVLGRRRGRPRLEEPLVPVSTRVPARTLDRLIALANKRDMKVAEVLRLLIERRSKPGNFRTE